MKIGLTLGKFAPFHKGHEHIITVALSEMDKVIVVIYDSPQVTKIPLNVRAVWIRQIFPEVEVIEGWDGPSVTGDTPEIKKIQEDYIKSVIGDIKVTHFYSSEFYGEHMSKALGAENRIIDTERTTVPISGTKLRENMFDYKEYLSPLVYKDHILNIVFVGAPSTGKTTLAEVCSKHFNTVWMPEYGREYWEKNQVNRRLSPDQLVEIAEGHIKKEELFISDANQFLFTDTNAITTFMFAQYYHGFAHQKLIELAIQAEKRYDVYILCDLDIPYEDTWDRSGDANREIFQKQIIADLNVRKIPYYKVSGSIKARLGKVVGILNTVEKFCMEKLCNA